MGAGKDKLHLCWNLSSVKLCFSSLLWDQSWIWLLIGKSCAWLCSCCERGGWTSTFLHEQKACSQHKAGTLFRINFILVDLNGNESDVYIALIFWIWSVPVGYEELGAGLEPIRNGKIFWMNNNHRYPCLKVSKWYHPGFANFIDEWSHCHFFTNFGVILEYLESSITMKKAIFRLSSMWSWHVYTIVRDTRSSCGSPLTWKAQIHEGGHRVNSDLIYTLPIMSCSIIL